MDRKIPQGITSTGAVRTTTARKVGEKIVIQAAEGAARKLVDEGYKHFEKKVGKDNMKGVATAVLAFAGKVLKGIAWDAATLGAPLALLWIGRAAEMKAETERRKSVGLAAYNTVDEIHRRTPLTAVQHRALRAQFEAFYYQKAKDLAFLKSHGGR